MSDMALVSPACSDTLTELHRRSTTLKSWLLNDALPIWWEKGCGAPGRGFYERVGQDGEPMVIDDRRARVQPRQVFCYAVSPSLGWSGPWMTAVDEGLSWFESVYRRDDGLYGNLADSDGKLIEPDFDLYNQAFALFAAAAIAVGQPEREKERHDYAITILDSLKQRYAHPIAGFEEASPAREPLCSNPHMHLFEAALAWEELPGSSPRWRMLADEIGNLALTRFIDVHSGALREFFDHDWQPMPGPKGRIVEPGHQFEWAWLLTRWGQRRGKPEAITKAQRLFEIGVVYGLCAERNVAVMSLYDDFTVHNNMARLWPQTEWLKAAVRLASLYDGKEREKYLKSAVMALDALAPFLATPIPGLWYDKWPKGTPMIDEPAPASTFYHIVCAVQELDWFWANSPRVRHTG